jgi:hypothetical protein
MALELVPLQRSPRTCFAQRPLTRLRLYPGFPQVVQDVTGNGRFMVDFSYQRAAKLMEFHTVMLTCFA